MTTEREAFEANIRKTRPTHCDLRKSKKGEYLYSIENQSWKTWQAACAWQREQSESCARKPLAAQQLDALIERWVGGVELGDGEYGSMVMFAAAVEREHGIGIVETDGADKIRSGA